MKPLQGNKVRIMDSGAIGTLIKIDYDEDKCSILNSTDHKSIYKDVDLNNITILEREYLVFAINENRNIYSGVPNLIVTFVPVIKTYVFVGPDIISSYSYDFDAQEKYIIGNPVSKYWEYILTNPEEHKRIAISDFYRKLATFDDEQVEVMMSRS